MQLQKLVLRSFRNYEEEEIAFGPKINWITGDNAQGKTNLLEAIGLLSTGRSFRTCHLGDLIREGANEFSLQAFFLKDGVTQSLSLTYDGKNRRIQHNSTNYASFLPLLGMFPSIILVPEDISLIMGSPSERRRFMDLHIAQLDPLYVHHLGRYYKALKQRNALLKIEGDALLSPWEQILAKAGSYLVVKRKQMIATLLPIVAKLAYSFTKEEENLHMSYESPYKEENREETLANKMLEHLQKTRKRDRLLKTTLSGPHRDDLALAINGKEAKSFCSEGQKRCVLTALRFGQWFIFKEQLQCAPLMGIDDFAIHLDHSRRRSLFEEMGQFAQSFLTSPHLDYSSEKEDIHPICICQGRINHFPYASAERRLALEGKP